MGSESAHFKVCLRQRGRFLAYSNPLAANRAASAQLQAELLQNICHAIRW